ncbi:phosphoglycerate kinase [Musa troglodytarum]|uniref:Phosphoglycerate kinase n=1 Tax=Musa troglodytarum TaxID=320322 RepID=A0A9E7KSP9_9LILI|nr:phosphoglycerate kinase [Musa troglodytarum]
MFEAVLIRLHPSRSITGFFNSQTHSQQEPNGQEVIKKPFNIQRTARWNFCRKENSPRNLFKEENAQEFTKKTIQM